MDQVKYYTPDISEFHVGFEYETLNDITKEYVPTIATAELMAGWNGSWNIINITNVYNKGVVRVKYLDRKDIESLGWSFYLDTEERIRANNLYREIKYRGESAVIELLYNKKSKWLLVYVVYEADGNKTIFAGKIKNKSELKKLMTQLGI